MPETSVQHSVNEPSFAGSALKEAPRVEEMLVIGPKRKSVRTANPLQGAINHFYLGMARRHAMNAIINTQYSEQNHFVSWVNFADAANQAAVYSTLFLGGGPTAARGLIAAGNSTKQAVPALILTANLAGELGTLQSMKSLAQLSAPQAQVTLMRASLNNGAFAEVQNLTIQSLNRAASRGSMRLPTAGQGSANARWYVPPIPVWDDDNC